MIDINIKFFGDNGDSGAGGGGGFVANNVAANEAIDSSDAWRNDLKPQGANPPTSSGNLSQEERTELIMKQLSCTREEAQKYAEAIEAYGNHKAEMQEAIHNVNSTYHKEALDLERYIKRSNRWAGGNTYMGMDVNAESFDRNNELNKVLNLKGASTWSSNAGNVNGNVRLISPTQSKGTGINHLSVHSGEKEVLASDAARYKIKKKYWEGRVLYVQVEEI